MVGAKTQESISMCLFLMSLVGRANLTWYCGSKLSRHLFYYGGLGSARNREGGGAAITNRGPSPYLALITIHIRFHGSFSRYRFCSLGTEGLNTLHDFLFSFRKENWLQEDTSWSMLKSKT